MKKFNNIVTTIGGILIMTLIVFVIAFIWVDNTILMAKIIGTNVILLGACAILDRVSRDS